MEKFLTPRIKRPGRKPIIPDDQLCENLKGFNLFINREKLKLKLELDEIWDEVCSKLNYKISRHHLYERLRQNRNNILNKLTHTDENKTVSQNDSSQNVSNSNLTDIHEALNFFFNDEHFKPLLKEISTSPLHLFYRWPEQIDISKKIMRYMNVPTVFTVLNSCFFENRIYNFDNNFIMCSLIAVINDTFIPLWQGIMTRKDVNFINYFICELLRENVPAPKYIVSPYSNEICNALSLAFNHCDINDYVIKCFNILGNESTDLLQTIIKVDIIPILEQLLTLLDDCFEGGFESVKEFFYTTIVFLTNVHNFDNFNSTIYELFYILQSEFQNEKMKNSRNNLLQKIKQYQIKEYKKFKNQSVLSDTFAMFNCSTKPHKIRQHFDNMKNDVLKELSGYSSTQNMLCIPNPYYNLSLLENLLNFLQYFPIWTNVMLDVNKTKNINFHDVTKRFSIQIDQLFKSNIDDPVNLTFEDFVKKHIQFLKESVIKGRNIIEKEKNVLNESLVDANASHEYLNFKENWMGKADITLQKNYLTDTIVASNVNSLSDKILTDESLDFKEVAGHSTPINRNNMINQKVNQTDLNVKQKPSKKPSKYCNANEAIKAYYNNNQKVQYNDKLIVNGSRLATRRWKNKIYSFCNTSCFDSIAELTVHAIRSYKGIHDELNNFLSQVVSETSFLKLMHDYATDGKLMTLYKNRLLLLLRFGSVENNIISCPESVENYFNYFFKNFTSYNKVVKCCYCNYEEIDEFSNHIKFNGNVNIDNFLETYFMDMKENCEYCSNIVEIKYYTKSYIAIHTDHMITKLDKLKTSVIVKEKSYFLAGLLSCTPPQSAYSQNHYVAHCYNSKAKTWKLFDSLESKVNRITNYKNEINVVLLLYILSTN